jgi:uncharacterized protein YdeI (YjbR/CyaY-like superfamily)
MGTVEGKPTEMPEPNPKKILAFATPKHLNQWLKKNHAIETELWVKILKKETGQPSVTWNDVVLETLCWGWIDGVKKSLDESAYLQRITPRKAKGTWSKKNTEHVAKLIEEGRMQPAGLVHVEAAKADGRWESAYAPPSEMTIPADFITALNQKPKAKKFYNTLKKSSLYVIAYSLSTAKKPETRQRRFDKFIDLLLREETPNFGFKKGKNS